MHLATKLNPSKWNVRSKLFGLLLIVILFSTAVLSINNFISLQTTFEEQNGNHLLSLGSEIYQRNIMLMQSNLAGMMGVSKTPALQGILQGKQNEQNLQTLFAAMQQSNLNIKSILISDKNGKVIYDTSSTGENSNTAIPNSAASYAASDIRYMQDTDSWEMDITLPVMKTNTETVIGYMQVTYELSGLFQFMDQTKIGQSGSAMIIDQNQTILYAPDRSWVGKPVPADYESFLNTPQTEWLSTQKDLEGNPALIAVIPPTFTENNPFTCTLLLEQDLNEIRLPIRNLLTRNWIIAGVSMFLLMGLAFFPSRSLFEPITIISASAGYLSKGDLSLRSVDRKKVKKMLERQDEMGNTGRSFSAMIDYFREMSTAAAQIAVGNLSTEITPKSTEDSLGNAFRVMIASLRETISDLNMQAEQLKEAAESLTTNAEETNNGVQQISNTMQQVYHGTTQQSESIHASLKAVKELSHAIEGVAHGAQEQAHAVHETAELTDVISHILSEVEDLAHHMSDGSQQAAASAENGSQVVQQTIQGMMNIKVKVDQSVEKVTEMGNRSRQIESILDTINDIAGQTNLLALNAAIEAARAGEHGKGFAVVADEVRKLAERSAAATKEIAQIIAGIQESVQDAVEVMREGVTQVDYGVDQANNAGNALQSIYTDIHSLRDQAQTVENAMQSMNRAVDDVLKSSETVSSVVEENTAATEEMAASSAEVNVSIAEIADFSEESSAMIEQVAAATAQLFKQTDMVSNAAYELMSLAEHLAGIVSQYKIEDN